MQTFVSVVDYHRDRRKLYYCSFDSFQCKYKCILPLGKAHAVVSLVKSEAIQIRQLARAMTSRRSRIFLNRGPLLCEIWGRRQLGPTGWSTQTQVYEGQTGSHRAKRAIFGKGVRKFSKTYIANGAISVIPELY